jgi:uncharacterized protein involved in response to NO
MPLVQISIVLIVVGAILWMANAHLPMGRAAKSVINVAAVLGVIVYALWLFGFMNAISRINIGAK